MKSKTIIGMIATAALCVVLSQVSTSLKEKECMPFICIEEKGHDLSLIEEVLKKG